jgi:hypothetical protein
LQVVYKKPAGSQKSPGMAIPKESYDAFLSYSTRADYQHARALESFLESLHNVRGAPEELRVLRVCRDGSDFRLPRGVHEREGDVPGNIWPIIVAELQRSNFLVVLCCPEAVRSPWIAKEIEWFLDNSRPDRILLAVTDGRDPEGNPEEVFPSPILRLRRHIETIWYDLRRYRSRPRTGTVFRDYEDEQIRLASDLLGWDPGQRGTLVGIWQRERRRALKRTIALVGFAAFLLFLTAATALWQRSVALEHLRDSQVLAFKFATAGNQFNHAAESLQGVDLDDPRLKLASWFAEQHRSFPTHKSEPLIHEGIQSLAFDPISGSLAGISTKELLVLDPEELRVISSSPLPLAAKQLVAGDQPSTFYAVADTAMARCLLVNLRWHCRKLPIEAPVQRLKWFGASHMGLGLKGHDVVALRDEGERVRLGERLYRTVSPTQLVATSDNSAIAVAKYFSNLLNKDFEPGLDLIYTAYTLEHGRITKIPIAPRRVPVQARLVGNTIVAQLLKDDSLVLTRVSDGYTVETRPIFYKTWPHALVPLPGAILVQEVGDTTMETVAKFAVIDLATGMDLIDGFMTDEAIWSHAIDPRHPRHFFSGQYGRLDVVDISARRVKSMSFPIRFREPMVPLDDGRLWLRSSGFSNRGYYTVWEAEPWSGALKQHGDHYPCRPYGENIQGSVEQNYPFIVDLSPNRNLMAFRGEELMIVQLPATLPTSGKERNAELARVMRQACADDNLVFWTVPIDPAPLMVRWLTDELLVAHGFHGHAILLNLKERTHRRLDIQNDVVGMLTARGTPLFSTWSGRVWKVTPDGKPELFQQIPGLRKLFPLDEAGRFFVGWCVDPDRTCFFGRGKQRLEEVASVTTTLELLDAALADGKVMLLYPESIRMYPIPLP